MAATLHSCSLFILSVSMCWQIVLRINCLSTEFSPQKGVKGLPLHLVVDTYEDMDTDKCEPVHRGYCRVKIFRDKVSVRRAWLCPLTVSGSEGS